MYRDNETDYDRVEALVGGILDDALAEIAARLDTRGEGVPLVVYNPLAWARSEPVRLTLRLSAPPKRLAIGNADGITRPTQFVGRAWPQAYPPFSFDTVSLVREL